MREEQSSMDKTLLVTGGAGFIGSNFIRMTLQDHPDESVINLDKLTYSGNLGNLVEIDADPRYEFVRGDICDSEVVTPLAERADWIVNFAAETHVDRSLTDPGSFIQSNVNGPYVLLEAAMASGCERFLQISTDEVYGDIPAGVFSSESDLLKPCSPYSAAKAGGELIVRSYFDSFGVPVLITRGSNNIGPYQYPEKVVPLFVTNALDDTPLPIYGSGTAVRDYIHVDDHCLGIDRVLRRGEVGEAYNIGGGNSVNTVELADQVLARLGKPAGLVEHVKDRPGHDQRYAVDTSKIEGLGWKPKRNFEASLSDTVDWYESHRDWWEPIKRGEYAEYYARQYGASDGS